MHGLVNWAILNRVVAAVGMTVMVNAMDVLADHFFLLPAKHTGRCRIHVCGHSVAINTVDTIPHRAEQQLVLALIFLEQRENILPFNQTAAHGAFDVRLVLSIALLIPLAQHQNQVDHSFELQSRSRQLQLDPLAILARTGKGIGPALALFQNRLSKDNQLGQRVPKKPGHGELEQLMPWVAK